MVCTMRKSSTQLHLPMRTSFELLALIIIPTLSSSASLATTNTWISGNGFWTDTANWLENIEPTAQDDVVFDSLENGEGGWVRLNAGSAGLPYRSARSLTFLKGVGTYLIDGNTGGDKKELLVGEGGILNLSSNTQIFEVQVFVAASQVWDARGGDIWADDVVQLANNTLTVIGAHDVTISGAVTGSGSLIKEGIGVLTLGSPNTYTGDTIIREGTLTYLADQSTTGALLLEGGLLDANDHLLNFGSLTLSGPAAIQLGTDLMSQSVSFGTVNWNGGTLSVMNWSTLGSSDQLTLATQPSQEFLSSVHFQGFNPGGAWLSGLLVPAQIPEPSATCLVAVGLAGLLAGRFRGRRQPASSPRSGKVSS